ncbi:MAG: hypothetical protein JWN69_259 [Alphaproteobacteria bacterium]|nr:hypothetical protein [Alphaproteobacteria bacterium]
MMSRSAADPSLSEDDKAYYYRRAEQEIACAQASTEAKVVSFHYHLAGFYLDRVFGAADEFELSAIGLESSRR